jgi:hypothetical protein
MYFFFFFDGENISFDASLVICINSTNIPRIMIINRIYENQKSSVAVACFLPGRAKDLSARLYQFCNVSIFYETPYCDRRNFVGGVDLHFVTLSVVGMKRSAKKSRTMRVYV